MSPTVSVTSEFNEDAPIDAYPRTFVGRSEPTIVLAIGMASLHLTLPQAVSVSTALEAALGDIERHEARNVPASLGGLAPELRGAS